MTVSACSGTALKRPQIRCQHLEVRAKIAKVEGVLLAELIVRFVVNTVTRNYLSAESQALKQCYDLLGKQQTTSDSGHICGIGKAWEDDLLADCRHGISNDLVLKLDWEVVEGEYAIDLVVLRGKFPKKWCHRTGNKP